MNTTTTPASSRLARIASRARAMKISIGRIGARTSCRRSVPTKKLLITVGNPSTSISTDSAVNAPASIESRASGRNCAPASPAENTNPPNTIAPTKSRITISTNRPGRPLWTRAGGGRARLLGRSSEHESRRRGDGGRRRPFFRFHPGVKTADQLPVAIGELEQAEQPLHALLPHLAARHPIKVGHVVE